MCKKQSGEWLVARWVFWILVFFSGVSTPLAAQNLGDVDGDDTATVRDVAQVVQFLKNNGLLTESQQVLADVDGDGGVSELDVNLLVSEIIGGAQQVPLPLCTVKMTTPGSGDGSIGTASKVTVDFNMPLAVGTTLTDTVFYAEFGGVKLPATIVMADNRRKVSLVFAPALPANARVTVKLDGTGINDVFARAIDLDGDGSGGGTLEFFFETLSIIPIEGTAVIGRVFASELDVGGGSPVDVPLAGVTISIDGTTVAAVTDALGNFTLSPSPAGTFFIHIDGRTSPLSNFPAGDYYPVVGKVWSATAGRTNNPAGGGTGNIYLPCICSGTLQVVSATQDTSVPFPAQVLTDFPEFAGASITVPGGSLRNSDGTPGGMVGIAPVPPDRLPGTLPPGLDLPIVITVQTDGAPNFDTPAPITLPNVADPVTGKKLPAGSKSALWSFDHELGEWIVVGPMTVTADGNFIKTDPGVGVRAPGWHGSRPGSQGRGNTQGLDCGTGGPALARQVGAVVEAGVNAGIDLTTSTADVLDAASGAGGVLRFFQGFALVKNVHSCFTTDPSKPFLQRALPCTSAVVAAVPLIAAAVSAPLSAPVAGVFTVAGLALNAVGLYQDMQDLEGAMDPIASKVNECVGKQPRFTPAQQTQHQQRVTQSANTTKQAASNARTQAQAQIPLYEDIKNDIEAVDALAQQFRNVSPANPTGGLTEAQWTDFSNRMNTIGGKMRNLSKLPSLQDILRDLMDKNRRFNDDIRPSLLPPLALPPPPVPGGGGGIWVIDSIPPPPPPPGPAYCLLERTGFQNRFRTDGSGAFSAILSPGQSYKLSCYEPSNNRIGYALVLAPANGRLARFPRILLWQDGNPDGDGDTLSDKAEDIIGTNPTLPDTDNDGITDGAEVRQGTDPLDGLPSATGVVARAPVSGSAEDICVINNIAITANGAAGISVFNVFNGLNPVRIIEFNTTGSALAVACSGNLIAIADFSAGLQILDITDTLNPKLVRQVNLGGNVMAVTADGPVAYAGTDNGNVFCVDMNTGAVLNSINIPHGKVEDLFVARETLYVLQTGKLSTVVLGTQAFGPATTVIAPGGTGAGQRRLRLFAGGGVLYSTWRQGYNIFDIDTDPNNPVHIQQVSTSQQGWKHLIANGSGLGIAAVSPNSTNDGPHHIDIYDLGANGQGSTYLNTINTPGLAAAVTINCGIAYVADSAGGLTVVNYRTFDTAGQAPTISLESNFSLPGGAVEENALMRLTAAVTDDVQVCTVEFYVDDELRVTDGNYPFEYRFRAPQLSAGQIKVKAKVTDTGGNITWSTEFTMTLTPDAVPPTVIAHVPTNNTYHTAINEISVVFSEEMDTSTLAAGGLTLVSAGPDKIFGNTDDIPITNGQLNFSSGVNAAFLAYSQSLDPGTYRVSVQSPAADLAGNVILASSSADFILISNSDDDMDGLPDDLEPLLGLLPGNEDTDNNGTLDGDEDFDDDGIPNGKELELGLDPSKADSDGDGIPDGAEDFDFDLLTNAQEFAIGTNPLLIDTDGDGLDDFNENAQGSDPTDANSGTTNSLATGHVTFQNALNTDPPLTLMALSASSLPVFYVNALSSTPPTTLEGVSASSLPVIYQNTLWGTAPATLNVSAATGAVSYENQTP